MFGIGWESQRNCKNQSFVLWKGYEQGQQVLRFAKLLLLFGLSATGVDYIDYFTYFQYMEVTTAVSGVHRIPECIFLPWTTADGVYRTV